MHVAICSDGIFPASMGGIERHTRLLVESLARLGPEVRISVIHTHPGSHFFDALPGVTEIAVDPKPGRRQYLLECIDLSARFADVLHALPDAVIYSQGVCVCRGIQRFSGRLIVNPHGLESFQTTCFREWAVTAPFRLVQRRILKHAHTVVSLGGRLSGILRDQVPAGRITVIPNGVNPPSAPVDRSLRAGRPFRVLFVGRLAPNKGVGDLISAIEALHRKGLADRVELDIAGTGPLLETLKLRAPSPSIRFWGKVSDAQLDELYARADVFVLPTLFEGMPTVVLEAMARGLPILVTDVGATTELVDSHNGAIIRRKDPSGLAARLLQFMEMDPSSLLAMGRVGIDRVHARFTWPRVAEAHLDLFKRVHAAAFGP